MYSAFQNMKKSYFAQNIIQGGGGGLVMLTRLLTAHQSEVKHNEDYESWVKDSQANQEPTNDLFKNFFIRAMFNMIPCTVTC